MKMKYTIVLAVLALMAGAFATVAQAARTKDELMNSFAQRSRELRKLKDAGKIGENLSGFVEIVNAADKDDKEVSGVVDGENTDRKELYAIVAKDQGSNEDEVAKVAAKRNYKLAEEGDYLKNGDGEWIRKPGSKPTSNKSS